jgi:hypothetical protein
MFVRVGMSFWRRFAPSAALAALVVGPGPATAQTVVPATPNHLEAVRVAQPPRIDDYLDGGSHPGQAVTDFKQRTPKDLEPATEATTAYVSYDESTLYVAFVCRVSRLSDLRARKTKREDIFSDDFVGVMLDTFLNKQRAYLFFTTPRAIQADGITAASTGDDYSFDTQWRTDAKVTPTGYVALLAIPFKVLRFPLTADGLQHWGFALARAIPAKDETDFWPAITNRLNGILPQFGVLDGLAGASPGRNIQLIPYGTFTSARFLDTPNARYATRSEGRTGLDAKLVAHDALTFDLTLNPDFSQVESDDPQVTVNQRFEVFFPEKRPFFLENADVFNDVPQTLFFSRRIGDPQFGGRVTGQIGHWALGAIATDDREPGRQVAPGTAGTGDRTGDAVFRARYDFTNQSRLGFLGTVRSFGPSSNTVGAVDTRIRLNPLWVIQGQTVVDAAADLTGRRTTGTSTEADVSRSGRQFAETLAYVDASPNFHTDLGFIPRVDYRQVTNFLTLRWFPKTGPVIDFGPNSFVQATTNWGGTLTDSIIRLPFQLDLKRSTSLFYRHAFITETVSGVKLVEREDLAQCNTDYLKWIGGYVSYSHGTRPNYFPAAGLLPFLGTFTDVAAGLTFRPTTALSVSETYLYSRLDARSDSPGAGTIFTNPIHRLRVNYQFTREWSLRAILDYSRVTPNTALVALSRARHAGVDVLLTWLLHPGTALYIGYTDGYDNVRLDPLAGVEATPGALSSTGRQVFVKSSWLLRF